ncbi:tetratricopeptide repeat protein 28-like [Actinia tenebrosa]|uniref:Tetratricopeptide repeat protein 28-like n=1 Tax=Actinia tenebrosa TaxID=6105 RepID=A0A6P8H8M2_ACTTE|nr:tetratricopeptide repeat protein 28-like [Actinia tenebrosa]
MDDENDPKQFRLVKEDETEIAEKIRELKDLLIDASESEVKPDEANVLSCLGLAYFKIGNFDLARQYQEKYLALATELEDEKGKARAHCNLGCINKACGDSLQAKEEFEIALTIGIESGNKRVLARTYNNLANIYELEGNLNEALDCHHKRLALSHELKDTNGIGKACASLGNLYHVLGDLETSIHYYQEMLKILREKLRVQDTLAEDSDSEGDDAIDLDMVTMQALADAQEKLKEEERRKAGEKKGKGLLKLHNPFKKTDAKKKEEDAGKKDEKKKEKKSIKTCHSFMIKMMKNIFPYKENDPNQFRYLEQTMADILATINRLKNILKELEDEEDVEHDKAVIFGYIGVAYFKIGYYKSSKNNYEKQLSLAHDLGDRKTQGTAYTNLGCLYSRTGDLAQALECFEKSLMLARDRGDRKSISRNLNNLANVYELRSELGAAVECHEERLEISREMKDLDGICKACSCLGGLYRASGQLALSIERYEDLLEGLRDKLRIQSVLADDVSDSDDDVDVDEIAYEIMRERMEELKRYENVAPKKTTITEKIQTSCGNIGFLMKSLVKR